MFQSLHCSRRDQSLSDSASVGSAAPTSLGDLDGLLSNTISTLSLDNHPPQIHPHHPHHCSELANHPTNTSNCNSLNATIISLMDTNESTPSQNATKFLSSPSSAATPLIQNPNGATNHVAEQGNQNAVVFSTEEALLKLSNRTKYPIVQENGQRCYGPPPDWEGPSPERGCEVFVGKIPRDCFEDELVPIFETIGPIYMFRLMMDFNGSNRGYGFCMYTSREHAKQSVMKLDNYEIRTDKMLGVCQSVDNCRLFVGGIPKTKSKEEIFVEMSKVTEGVRDVIVYPSAADKSKNRGFAFVEYESHKSAAMARRKLIPGRIQLWGQQIAVDWAEPEREVDESIMSGVRVLYVRNLMLSTSEDTLRDLFNKACDSVDAIERVKKMRDYAFVHFRERKLADMAMKRVHNTEIEGSRVEVSWAKPVDKSESAARSAVKNGSAGGISSKSGSGTIPVLSSNTLMSMPFYFDPLMCSNFYAASPNTPGAGATSLPSGLNLVPTLATAAPSTPSSNNNNSRQAGVRGGRVYRNAAGSRSAGSRSNIPGYQRDRKTPNDLTPNPLLMGACSSFVDMLEEVCHKNNWGTPAYSTAPQDVVDPTTGQQVTLHLGQVSIPGVNQYYMAPSLSFTAEEARQAVAKSVLTLFNMQMHLQAMDVNYQTAALSLLQAAGVPGGNASTDSLSATPCSVYFDAASMGLVSTTGSAASALGTPNFLNISPMLTNNGDLFGPNLCFTTSNGPQSFQQMPQ